ncbi:MAG: T9SS type A sorting domain-containing protein [Bacteroidota bacterium]
MRMKIFTMTILSVFLSIHSRCEGKGCTFMMWVIGGGDTIVCPGDTISVDIAPVNSGGGFGGNCVCLCYRYQWFKDGFLLPGDTNRVLHVSSIGTYRNEFIYDCGSKYVECTIGYNNCGTTSINSQDGNSIHVFSLFPTISTGIFLIKKLSQNVPKQLRITDNAGHTIFTSVNNFSEIDLTNFSPGIYFYAITDEKENIFRGRILKE